MKLTHHAVVLLATRAHGLVHLGRFLNGVRSRGERHISQRGHTARGQKQVQYPVSQVEGGPEHNTCEHMSWKDVPETEQSSECTWTPNKSTMKNTPHMIDPWTQVRLFKKAAHNQASRRSKPQEDRPKQE